MAIVGAISILLQAFFGNLTPEFPSVDMGMSIKILLYHSVLLCFKSGKYMYNSWWTVIVWIVICA
jgi:hypothetical protein